MTYLLSNTVKSLYMKSVHLEAALGLVQPVAKLLHRRPGEIGKGGHVGQDTRVLTDIDRGLRRPAPGPQEPPFSRICPKHPSTSSLHCSCPPPFSFAVCLHNHFWLHLIFRMGSLSRISILALNYTFLFNILYRL